MSRTGFQPKGYPTSADPDFAAAQFVNQVSRQKVDGVRRVSITGRASMLIGAGGFEDIWDGQASVGLWVPPTTDRIHDLSSTSALDTLAGTGAQKILVQGISGGFFITEIVDMAGAGNAPTVNAYDSIHRMDVIQSGSGLTNAGDISAIAQGDATLTSLMLTDNNRTFQGTFKTPSNEEYLVEEIFYAIDRGGGGGTDAEFRIVTFLEDINIVTASIPVSVTGTGSSAFNIRVPYPFRLPVNSYVKIQADASQNNTIADAVLFGATFRTDLS